ncbi:hypothetical protein A8F94_07330 [Bacillus sp. FJAT-27225]|nr:hypothetical protein A8F94_07330 [Bacillus sp. FJAT-27225]
MKESQLLNRDDIWNAVIRALSKELHEEDPIFREPFIVFQYYSELESGGHEAWLTWMGEDISKAGIEAYLKDLTNVLKKIHADEYSAILDTYGKKMWEKYRALEKGETAEDDFYEVIEKADQRHYQLNGKLHELIEDYFVSIHRSLIDVV